MRAFIRDSFHQDIIGAVKDAHMPESLAVQVDGHKSPPLPTCCAPAPLSAAPVSERRVLFGHNRVFCKLNLIIRTIIFSARHFRAAPDDRYCKRISRSPLHQRHLGASEPPHATPHASPAPLRRRRQDLLGNIEQDAGKDLNRLKKKIGENKNICSCFLFVRVYATDR